MARVKRGVTSRAKHKKVLKAVKVALSETNVNSAIPKNSIIAEREKLNSF